MLPNIEIIKTTDDTLFALYTVNDLISSHVRAHGSYQSNLVNTSLELMKHFGVESKNVIDVGANIGTFTIPVAKEIKGTVYAFEAQRHVFMQLNTNCFINRLDNVYPIHGLVGHKNGGYQMIPIVDLSKSQNTGAFSINQENIDFQRSRNFYLPETIENATDAVQNISIDSVVGIKCVGLVKIDVEGEEFNVLHGMIGILMKDKPIIIFECLHDNAKNNIIIFLQSLGYKIFNIKDDYDNYLAIHSNAVEANPFVFLD